MYTHAVPPWIGDDKTSRDFNEVHNDFMELINSNKFELSENVIYPEDRLFSTLMWRHYHVFWSVKYAINATGSGQKNFVECGVCDGVTAYFVAKTSIAEKVNDPKLYLYDSWGKMESKYLTESEKKQNLAGNYSCIDIERTKSNLKEFGNMVSFKQGFLPESLEYSTNPENLVWMHIDLNSAKPTLAVLE